MEVLGDPPLLLVNVTLEVDEDRRAVVEEPLEEFEYDIRALRKCDSAILPHDVRLELVENGDVAAVHRDDGLREEEDIHLLDRERAAFAVKPWEEEDDEAVVVALGVAGILLSLLMLLFGVRELLERVRAWQRTKNT